MARKDFTIYDVAGKAGVSIATVSRVLNSPMKVAEATKDKVLTAIKDLDFIPKAEAVARARQDFRRIGVLLPFFTAPSFIQRIRGVLQEFNDHEYEIITYAVENVEQLKGYLTGLPLGRRIDGLISMALPFSSEDVERFVTSKVPLVSVEYPHPDVSHVVINNREGGGLAARFFINAGHDSFGFIGEGGEPPYSLHATDERLEGFTSALQHGGYRLPETRIFRHPYGMEHSLKSAEKLLKDSVKGTAVFAASDMEAVAVLMAAETLGLRVIEDFCLLGFDNIDLASYMGISTICQSLDESGKTAARLLADQIKDPAAVIRQISFPLRIIERKTTHRM